MNISFNCFWSDADKMTAFNIGSLTHIRVNDSPDIVLSVENLKQLGAAIDAHLKDYDHQPVPAAKIKTKSYVQLTDQSKLVYRHMDRAGSISARDAMDDYGITSATLARRICDIEAEGFKVYRDRRIHPITGKRYTRYALTA